MVDHLERHNANIARAMHQLGAESTEAFEAARDKVAAFIGAPVARRGDLHQERHRGAQPGRQHARLGRDLAIGAGDEVVITEMEHHSNIVPWQLLTERTGATLRWFGLTDDGRLDLSNIDELITERTKVVSLTWVSNMLGTINPVAEIAARAHEVGALVVVDASQAVPQLPVDVQDAGADFLAFTGHKVVGPTGIGVLWGRESCSTQLPPFHGGGEMIETVTHGAVDLRRASRTSSRPARRRSSRRSGSAPPSTTSATSAWTTSTRHEQAITGYALEGLPTVPGLTVLGPLDAAERGGAIASSSTACTPTTSPRCSTRRGIAVRAGHHCAKPAHARFGVQSSTRMSSYLYTTPAEIDALVEGLRLHPVATSRWADRWTSTRSTRRSSWTTTRTPTTRACASPSRPRCTTSTRPAATRSPCACTCRRDGVVDDVSYDAVGCSISQASTSVMTDLVIGKPVDEAMAIHEAFLTLMQGKGQVEPDEDVLEDGIAFAGVAKFPARVKCALLAGWPGRTRRPRRAGSTGGRSMTDTSDRSTTATCPRCPGGRAGGAATVTMDDVTEAMKDVVDPELGINVVDLGLVYGVHLDEGTNVVLDMTLTSAACPLTDVIKDQTNPALEGLVNDVAINWVWMPPWGPDKITDDGREQLRALGFNV